MGTGLLRFLFTIFLIYVIFKVLKKYIGLGLRLMNHRQTQAVKREDLVEDPFCHTFVPISHAFKKTVGGKTQYFCSKKCIDEFLEKADKQE